ncbi:MAG: hypothetical protein LC725_02255 [Lentisphaerae bacterium]|nr:hypothetical protein [Lentisphaerota bacterium]
MTPLLFAAAEYILRLINDLSINIMIPRRSADASKLQTEKHNAKQSCKKIDLQTILIHYLRLIVKVRVISSRKFRKGHDHG